MCIKYKYKILSYLNILFAYRFFQCLNTAQTRYNFYLNYYEKESKIRMGEWTKDRG